MVSKKPCMCVCTTTLARRSVWLGHQLVIQFSNEADVSMKHTYWNFEMKNGVGTHSFSYCCHLVLLHLFESLHIQDPGLCVVTNSI